MNDDTAPAWASALLQVINDRFDQIDARLAAIEQRMGYQGDKMKQAAGELKQADTLLDGMIAGMAGHTPEGRG